MTLNGRSSLALQFVDRFSQCEAEISLLIAAAVYGCDKSAEYGIEGYFSAL
jgi:hypothetical protein